MLDYKVLKKTFTGGSVRNYIWDKKKFVLKDGTNIVEQTRLEFLLMQLLAIKIEQKFYAYDMDTYEKNIRSLVFKLRKKLSKKTNQLCLWHGIYVALYCMICSLTIISKQTPSLVFFIFKVALW